MALPRKVEMEKLSISKHAQRRLLERHIHFNEFDYARLSEAAMRLKEKGSKESLVITEDAAFILDIAHFCLITAMRREEMADNIFTKIDATLVL